MRLAFISDMTRPSDRVDGYIKLTTEAVARAVGAEVEWEIIPAVETDLGKTPTMTEAYAAHDSLMLRLAAARPDTVVSLGTAAMHALNGKPPKGGEPMQLKKEHGRMRWLDVCADDLCVTRVPWTPGIAPAFVLPPRSGDLHRDFVNVVWKTLTQSAPLPPVDIEMVVARDLESLEGALVWLEGASVIGVDVETTGLSSYSDSVVTLGLGAISEDGTTGYAVIVREELLRDPAVQDVIWDQVWRRSRRSVGHNFKFDMQFVEPYIDWAPGDALIGDTLILGHLLDERPSGVNSRARGNGLKDWVAQRYDHAYGWDDFDHLPETEEAWHDFFFYLAKDVVYTARLWHDMVREDQEEGSRVLATHDQLMMPVAKAIAKAELLGAPIDEEWVQATVATLDRRIARREFALLRELTRLAPTQVIDNLGARGQIADIIYGEWGWTPDMRRRHKERSTEKEVLKAGIEKYRASPERREREQARWVIAFLKLRGDTYTHGIYSKSMLGRLSSDGRLRSSFLLHGAATGRISSEKPNLQNVPAVDDREVRNGQPWYKLRDGRWVTRPMRRAYAPEAPNVWVEVDYSQLELRVAAGISGDTAFTEVFASGRDVHSEVASAVFSKAPEEITKGERFLAKAVSFGIIYGRSAKALADGAEMDAFELEGGTRWTEKHAELFIRKFLASYPELTGWMARTQQNTLNDLYVESPRGRRRRFPLQPGKNKHMRAAIERQAVNTPIQSEASDLCLEAMARITAALETSDIRARVLFPVHDSVCLECHEDDVGALEDMCRSIMERDYCGVPLKVDYEWGPSWADVGAKA